MTPWSPTQHTLGHDTRRFVWSRLSISDGFKAIPNVDDSLAFVIPPTGLYTGRVVQYSLPPLEMEEDEEALVLELYSRNSTQFAFFPGRWNGRPDQAPSPRLDGNKGRFDPTKAPQYYCPHSPHLPFINRSESGQHSHELPENTPSFLVWESAERPAFNEGQVHIGYWSTLQARASRLLQDAKDLWLKGGSVQSWPGFLEACPNYSEDTRLWQTPARTSFDDFVTTMAEIQGWVKELAAWVKMAQLLEANPFQKGALSMSQMINIKADETLVGLWINGMDEQQVAWLWHIGHVPIFVVHRIRGVQDDPGHAVKHRVSDPIVGTPLNKSKAKSEWMVLAKTSGVAPAQIQYEIGVDESLLKPEESLFYWQSSSHAAPGNYPGQDMRQQTNLPLSLHHSSATIKTISAAHEAWIEPLEIILIHEKGSWEHFKEDMDDDGRTCFV
ncbi:hypothetical protein VKT23_006357 [Stygiomarasmius scandens]|uniref:Uncharacterized protein n=1 Tax=Marasmiellus scandens TaxID=2682957 RepID=A0ABR1JQ26_9AGAR